MKQRSPVYALNSLISLSIKMYIQLQKAPPHLSIVNFGDENKKMREKQIS